MKYTKTIANTLFAIVIVLAMIISISALAINADKFPSWVGFGAHSPQNAPQGYEPSKTFWDWLELLLVPLGLTFVAFILNRIEKQRDEDRAQETTLQSYLDNMTHLLLEKGLLTSESGAEVRTIARARTLTALHVLDSKRKGVIVQFLHEAHLIQSAAEKPIVSLTEADLTGVNLRNMRLKGANLSEAFMEYSDLSNTDMRHANLTKTRLSNSNISNAFMKWAKLQYADLSRANLQGAYLRLTNLSDTNLMEANLRKAVLDQANAKNANVTKAKLSKASLLDVDISVLIGATPKQLKKAKRVGEKTPKVILKHQQKDTDNDVTEA